ncbi:uncharacterized protein TNIN_390641 [Trichonephila inaurata madagascariensis]|uniref:Uncharacterized protein n=1 Tax=Trichonephila inaurata madagascariensis TaxID=2747483 RepID=A0A8X6I767_9ARAC|nr:uncharacterized protein TNIN_390641 [Trichonephila inaurata madagascariensis]
MSVKLIGKKSPYTGKLLFEILNNLKNYGLGRVIMRNSFKKFPETSFYIVRKVVPMRETIGPGPDELVYGNVWVDEVFRGRKLEGLRLLQSDTYLPDFYLVPREEEDQYLNYQSKDVIKILPKYDSVPPVIAEIIKKKDSSLKEEPKMEVVYKELSEHLVYKIAENGMKPDYKLKVNLPEKFKVGIK